MAPFVIPDRTSGPLARRQGMAIRTTTKTISFNRPFVLSGFDDVLPAGAYRIGTDEELLEGISFPAYRRIMTVIHLPANPDRPSVTQTLTVDPNELDAALKRDLEPMETPSGCDVDRRGPKPTPETRPKAPERKAIERGENEGMSVHPR